MTAQQFWEAVYVAAIRAGNTSMNATGIADNATIKWQERWAQ